MGRLGAKHGGLTPLRPSLPKIPTKAKSLADYPKCGILQTGAVFCFICRKALAVVGGMCVDCDHLEDDIRIDRTQPEGG